MTQNPYTPPPKDLSNRLRELGPTAASRSSWSTLAIAACYAWLAVLFIVWLQDGLNVLIEREIAFRVKLTTLTGTLLAAAVYARLRYIHSQQRTAVYLGILALLQFASMQAITNHTVDYFPF